MLLVFDNAVIVRIFKNSGVSGCSLDFCRFYLSWTQFGHSASRRELKRKCDSTAWCGVEVIYSSLDLYQTVESVPRPTLSVSRGVCALAGGAAYRRRLRAGAEPNRGSGPSSIPHNLIGVCGKICSVSCWTVASLTKTSGNI